MSMLKNFIFYGKMLWLFMANCQKFLNINISTTQMKNKKNNWFPLTFIQNLSNLRTLLHSLVVVNVSEGVCRKNIIQLTSSQTHKYRSECVLVRVKKAVT